MKMILTFLIIFLSSCEFEDQWKSGVLDGKIVDKTGKINLDVTIDLKNELFKIKNSNLEFALTKGIETKKSVYYQVKNSEKFPLPSYFQITKENLTHYRIQLFTDNDPNMIFGDLTIIFN